MEVVLDTVSVNHLLRAQGRHVYQGGQQRSSTTLDPHLQSGSVSLALDRGGGLLGEWHQTCGSEYVEQLVIRWGDFGALRLVDPVNKIPDNARRRLKVLGFSDTIDKLILRIALATEDRTVVSDDADFWDPADRKQRGERLAPICRLCRELLGVQVLLLVTLLDALA